MLGGRGGADTLAHVGAVEPLHASQRARLPVVAQALRGEVRVEQRVDAPVRRLLADEGLDRRLETRALGLGQRLHAGAHRIDEELLADRKAHRQRVEPGRAEGVRVGFGDHHRLMRRHRAECTEVERAGQRVVVVEAPPGHIDRVV